MRDIRVWTILAVLILCFSFMVIAQDKTAKPAEIALPTESQDELKAMQADFKDAVQAAEVARLKQENVQLKYALLVRNLKDKLAVPEDYEFNDAKFAFIQKAKPAKQAAAPAPASPPKP